MLLRNIFYISRSTEPTNIILSNDTIIETSAIGTTIGTLTTVDENINDTFIYSIITDTDNKFIIDGNILKTKSTLDYETSTTHSVTIRSTDNKGLYYTKSFTINVTSSVRPWVLTDTASFAFYNSLSGITDAGAGKVSAWSDFLGNATRNIAQGTGANRPTLTSDGVVFNGTTDFLFNTNPFIANSANGVIVIAIVSAPANTSTSAQWAVSEASTISTNPNLGLLCKDNIIIDYGKITQAMRNDANTSILSYGGNSGINNAFDNTFKIICHKLDKSTGFITTWINGVIETPPLAFTPSGTFTMNRFTIGCLSRATNLSFWSGTFKGVSILNATVSEADRQRTEGYLAHLYGQTTLLPNNHPYKNSAPTTTD